MTKSKTFLLLLFLMIYYGSTAQRLEVKTYVVLTMEDEFSKGFEGVKKTFWIAELEAIRSTTADKIFSPLVMDGFSKASFDSCCMGAAVDPFTLTSVDTAFYIGDAYYKDLEQLRKIIPSGNKMVQQVTKYWPEYKSKEVMTFYVAVIKGKFCSSHLTHYGQARTGYKEKIFYPYASFESCSDSIDPSTLRVLYNLDFVSTKLSVVR